jgi:hypothetical protein
VVDRHEQAVGFHQLGKDILQDVLSVARVGYAPPDEVAQAPLLPPDHIGDPPVLFECHPLPAGREFHLQM